jgi:hypothetical protein
MPITGAAHLHQPVKETTKMSYESPGAARQASTSAEQVHTKTVTMYVNGQAKRVERRDHTFEEIVRLAFDSPNANFVYTVTYSKGEDHKKEGTLVAGQSVKVAPLGNP